MRLFMLMLLAAACWQAKAQQVSVAPYDGGRLAALSLTFDDGLQDQYTLAYPELRKRGLRATFASIGSKRDTMWLYRWVEGLIAQGEWGVGMTHGIACGYDHFKDPQVMWALLDYLVERQHRIWVAPFREVAAYIKERQQTRLDVSKVDGRLLVKPVCMIDARLFRQPLTMVVEGDAPLHVIQDGKELNVCRKDGVTLVDFNPHGGEIVVSY